MSILSQKRQVTLPKDLCDRLLVQPGDDLSIVEHEGRITLIKRTAGSSDGVLRRLKTNEKISDDASLHDSLGRKHVRRSALA
ncbi:MAG: AbrB/MazE/SpoVT family DNA-binding domain-containing protein [Oxalobacteraceae bacterium]|nr:AbrB/MazE/SpoVT family DNA-binding domain-containing protein [Oxalobacteraceae bacterium]